jgi:quinol monooxygenase YgiN
MMTRRLLIIGAAVLISMGLPAAAQQSPGPYVRWAELDVDSGKTAGFGEAARDNAAATLQEPGVIAFHSAAEKGNPQRIRVLEIYEDETAYRDHLQTPHFQRFAQVAQTALLARRIYDAVPIALGAKPLLTTTAPHVRVAELDIAPDQLALYKAAVIEEIEDSIRLEPGVLAIYSMSLQDSPHRLRFFEVYADEAAYLQHIASPHFKKYVEITKSMITSRKLFEMESPFLGMKAR